MNDIELLEYFINQEEHVKQELHAFIWNNAKYDFRVDLYFYPDTKEFYAFTNIGGNSWLNDNHICIWHTGNTEIENSHFREYVNEMTECAYDSIVSNLKTTIKQEKYYNE
ncbi:MAG: hypothetical protein PUF49_05075 [Firmicutes bacterium]|nr:hypothetical protein [Bacillota bacterium]